jgi:hypothetical protein
VGRLSGIFLFSKIPSHDLSAALFGGVAFMLSTRWFALLSGASHWPSIISISFILVDPGLFIWMTGKSMAVVRNIVCCLINYYAFLLWALLPWTGTISWSWNKQHG